MPTIRVNISADGQKTDIKGVGFTSDGCKTFTQALAKALSGTIQDGRKLEDAYGGANTIAEGS
jgi:hypothetical protein